MSEKSIIWVSYDKSETYLSCVVCTEPKNGRAKMRVGYMGDDADELYKIVSEQGYLTKHDKDVRNRTIDEAREALTKMKETCDSNGHNCDMCEYTRHPYHQSCADYVLEQMKEGGDNG